MKELLNTVSLVSKKKFSSTSIKAFNTLETDKRKNSLIRNFFRYKVLIQEFSEETSNLLMNEDSIDNEVVYLLVKKLQHLNMLEPSLIYKNFEWFSNDYKWAMRDLELPNSNEEKIKIKSDISMRSVQGRNIVENYFDIRYGAVNFYDKSKWNYSRYSLLENLTKLKLETILITTLYLNNKKYSTKRLIKNINKLEEDIKCLYNGKLTYWKEDVIEYTIKEYQRFNPQINPENSIEDYRRPYEFLLETGVLNEENLSDIQILKLIKLGLSEYLLKDIKIRKRINHIYKNLR